MCVIRTELYFDPEKIESAHKRATSNPGISIAWIGHDIDDLVPEALRVFSRGEIYQPGDYVISQFLDGAIRGITWPQLRRELSTPSYFRLNNLDVIDYSECTRCN